MKAAITMQQQYFNDHSSKRGNKNMTNFELDAFHFWLRKNHAPIYRRDFKTSLSNGAVGNFHCLLVWQLEKAASWYYFSMPHFKSHLCMVKSCSPHGNYTLDFWKGRLYFSSFLTLQSPWEFYLKKVLERSKKGPKLCQTPNCAFVPVLDCSGHGQAAGL